MADVVVVLRVLQAVGALFPVIVGDGISGGFGQG